MLYGLLSMAAIFATSIAGATRGAAREEVPHLVHQDNADDDGHGKDYPLLTTHTTQSIELYGTLSMP